MQRTKKIIPPVLAMKSLISRSEPKSKPDLMEIRLTGDVDLRKVNIGSLDITRRAAAAAFTRRGQYRPPGLAPRVPVIGAPARDMEKTQEVFERKKRKTCLIS